MPEDNWINKDIYYYDLKIGEITFKLEDKVLVIKEMSTHSTLYGGKFLRELLPNSNSAYFVYPPRMHYDMLAEIGFIPSDDGIHWEWHKEDNGCNREIQKKTRKD